MRIGRKIRSYSIVSVSSLTLVATLQVGFAQLPNDTLPPGFELLAEKIQPETELLRYIEVLSTEFSQADADADGKLNSVDVEIHELMDAARARSNAALSTMRYDIDGDGLVTWDEVRAAMRYDQRNRLAASSSPKISSNAASAALQIEKMVQTLSELDADKDGKLSYAEAGASNRQQSVSVNRRNSLAGRTERMLALGTKGEISLNSFLAAGQALFRKVDKDGSDKIDQQELIDYWQGPSAPDNAAQAKALEAILARSREIVAQQPNAVSQKTPSTAGCAMPPASADAKVVLLSSYETDALSSATIGSQDAVIHAGKIVVEPGSDKLYVVVISHSATIWQFSGATERIERVVLTARETKANGSDPAQIPLVGATGIPRERVSFFAKVGCLNDFTEVPSSQSVRTLSTLREQLGREPYKIVAQYSVGSFHIPSGKFETAPNPLRGKIIIQGSAANNVKLAGDVSDVIVRAGPSRARDDLFRFSPGGVIEIEPKSVVSSLPATAYEVLPQQAGLVQLLDSGALKQNKSGEYVVQKKMRIPAGLYGAHQVKFVVPRGVPVPEGDFGHSCIVVEDGPSKMIGLCR